METQTIGDKIAKDFSDDKCYLSDAEQRRLAGMIDQAAIEMFVEGFDESTAERNGEYGRPPLDVLVSMARTWLYASLSSARSVEGK